MDAIATIGQSAANIDRRFDDLARMQAEAVERASLNYRREVHLARLFPHLVNSPTEEIVTKLGNALRAAQNAARTGHWTSDGNRTMAVRIALAAEQGALAAEQNGSAA